MVWSTAEIWRRILGWKVLVLDINIKLPCPMHGKEACEYLAMLCMVNDFGTCFDACGVWRRRLEIISP